MRRLLSSIILLGLLGISACVSLSSQSGGESTQENINRRAEALARFGAGVSAQLQQDNASALSNYLRAAASDPDSEELTLLAVNTLLEVERISDAEKLLENFVSQHEQAYSSRLSLAFLYRLSQRFDEALQAYKAAERIAPKQAQAYIDHATLLTQMDHVDEASLLLKKALVKVEDPEVLIGALGEIYLRQATAYASNPKLKTRIKPVVAIYERQAAQFPENSDILQIMADLHILNGDLTKALSCFEKLENLHPENLSIKQRIAASFLALGDRTSAIKILEEMSVRAPNNARLKYYLADLYSQDNRTEEAVRILHCILDINPKETQAYLKLAAYYVRIGDEEKASAKLEQGLVASPTSAALWELKGYYLQKKYEAVQALDSLDKAAHFQMQDHKEAMSPQFNPFHLMVALQAQHMDRALELGRNSLDDNGETLLTVMNLIAEDQALNQDFVRMLEQLDEGAPDTPSILCIRALMLARMGTMSESFICFQRLEEVLLEYDNPPDYTILPIPETSYFFYYGVSAEGLRKFDVAEEQFRKVLAKDPSHADSLNYLAYMWAEQATNLDEALSFSQRSLIEEPENPAFLDTLGWIYYQMGAYPEALHNIMKAYAQIPTDPTVTEHLGDVYLMTGDLDKALQYWKESLVINPEQTSVADKIRYNSESE